MYSIMLISDAFLGIVVGPTGGMLHNTSSSSTLGSPLLLFGGIIDTDGGRSYQHNIL